MSTGRTESSHVVELASRTQKSTRFTATATHHTLRRQGTLRRTEHDLRNHSRRRATYRAFLRCIGAPRPRAIDGVLSEAMPPEAMGCPNGSSALVGSLARKASEGPYRCRWIRRSNVLTRKEMPTERERTSMEAAENDSASYRPQPNRSRRLLIPPGAARSASRPSCESR